jgi:hypothetical protein
MNSRNKQKDCQNGQRQKLPGQQAACFLPDTERVRKETETIFTACTEKGAERQEQRIYLCTAAIFST